MKHNVSLIVGALALAAAAGSHAQTAVTDPVGYITINVAGTASGNTFSAIAPTLVNKVEYSGVVTAITPDGKTLTVAGLTADAYNATAASSFWVEVTNGSNEGMWTNVVSNTASQILVADSLTSAITAGTSTIKIRQHITVDQFFGATNSAGLQSGGDAGAADEVTFIGDRGVSAQNFTVFYDGASWIDGDFNPAGTKVIEPGQGLLVARKATTNASFVQVGHVKTGKSMTSVLAGPGPVTDYGENVVGVRSAVGVTLGSSNLYTGAAATGVTAGGDSGAADEVIQFVGGAQKLYFHDGNGWVDSDFNDANPVVLAEGTALYIVRKTGGDFVWTAPAVTIAP